MACRYNACVTKEASVKAFLGAMSAQRAQLAREGHEVFLRFGCSSYVKTIYIGYDFDGEMVGALYPREDHLEVALALDEDDPHPLLIDAGHLTWRTLPVAALVSHHEQIEEFESLVSAAVHRIKSERHEVYRDNDYFAHRGGRRTGFNDRSRVAEQDPSSDTT
jgi:hypothetical protein